MTVALRGTILAAVLAILLEHDGRAFGFKKRARTHVAAQYVT